MPLSTGGKWGKAVDCSLILELFWSKWSTLWGLIDLFCCTISFPGFVWGPVEFSWLSLSSTSKAHRDGSNNCREKVILKRIFSRSFSSNCNILDPIIYKVWKWLWVFLTRFGQLFWIWEPISSSLFFKHVFSCVSIKIIEVPGSKASWRLCERKHVLRLCESHKWVAPSASLLWAPSASLHPHNTLKSDVEQLPKRPEPEGLVLRRCVIPYS